MKRTAMVAVLGLLSWSAQAAHDVPGWRVGAAASFSDFDWTDGDTDLVKDSTVGIKIHTQYQFNDWFGIEGAYHNTGDFEELSTDQNNPGELQLSFDGFSAALVGYFPVPSEEITLYGKVGLYDFDDELSLNGTVTSNSSEDGLMAGAGAMIEIADHFGIRADFDWFDAEVGDIWSVNLGLEYFFGGSGRKSGGGEASMPPPPPPPVTPAEPSAAASPAAEAPAEAPAESPDADGEAAAE